MGNSLCRNVETQNSTVFSVGVWGCVSFIRECVWVSCVGEAELQEVNRTISPALGFGTEPVNCGLEGKAVLPESEGWESF